MINWIRRKWHKLTKGYMHVDEAYEVIRNELFMRAFKTSAFAIIAYPVLFTYVYDAQGDLELTAKLTGKTTTRVILILKKIESCYKIKQYYMEIGERL